MYGESLDDAITSEFSGDEGRCLRMLSKDRLGVWATLVHKALTEGRLSADKEVLVRILGGADKGTVKAIARRYQQLFGAPLVLDLHTRIYNFCLRLPRTKINGRSTNTSTIAPAGDAQTQICFVQQSCVVQLKHTSSTYECMTTHMNSNAH